EAAARTAEITLKGPGQVVLERDADWYPLRLARELDRAILDLRHNQLDIGLWVLKTKGSPEQALALDALLEKHQNDWFVREVIGYLRRTLSRLDVSSRIDAHFCGDAPSLPQNEMLDAEKAGALGLVTSTPDDIDWEDGVRIAIEERASLSPDALTGMEACLRFAGPETMSTRVFGRLTAWQNWIFNRPNAVGEQGALKVYGTGSKAKFNWERV